MGYRSNVVLVINNAVHKALTPNEKDLLIRVFEIPVVRKNDFNSVLYTVESVKWYEMLGFDDVDLVMKMIDGFDHEDFGFIRIGEELDDIDVRGNPWNFDKTVHD